MIYAVAFVVAATADDLTPEKRAKLLKVTAEIVTVKVDEFEKRVSVIYSGPTIHMPTTAGELSAGALWPENNIQEVSFHLSVTRVEEGWHWLKFNDLKMLADGERVNLLEPSFDSDVFESGKVYESKSVSLTLDQMARICAAEKVKVKLGADEWEWTEKHRLPLIAVLGAWRARGGDASAYTDIFKRLARPAEGTAFAEVERKHGPPLWRDPETGWATWEWFWLRFKEGKVIESRPRPLKNQGAQ